MYIKQNKKNEYNELSEYYFNHTVSKNAHEYILDTVFTNEISRPWILDMIKNKI